MEWSLRPQMGAGGRAAGQSLSLQKPHMPSGYSRGTSPCELSFQDGLARPRPPPHGGLCAGTPVSGSRLQAGEGMSTPDFPGRTGPHFLPHLWSPWVKG